MADNVPPYTPRAVSFRRARAAASREAKQEHNRDRANEHLAPADRLKRARKAPSAAELDRLHSALFRKQPDLTQEDVERNVVIVNVLKARKEAQSKARKHSDPCAGGVRTLIGPGGSKRRQPAARKHTPAKPARRVGSRSSNMENDSSLRQSACISLKSQSLGASPSSRSSHSSTRVLPNHTTTRTPQLRQAVQPSGLIRGKQTGTPLRQAVRSNGLVRGFEIPEDIFINF